MMNCLLLDKIRYCARTVTMDIIIYTSLHFVEIHEAKMIQLRQPIYSSNTIQIIACNHKNNKLF